VNVAPPVTRVANPVPALPLAKREAPKPKAAGELEPKYELPIVPADPDAPHDHAMHPHPITPEHVRISKINGLIQSLNDAMSAREVRQMRALLREYRELDPEDEDVMQWGYGVVADCIEAPGAASLARARDFYDTQRASPLRRFIRYICFENR
jgi:hypothetical protein